MEVSPELAGWSFLRVCAGVGYLVTESGHTEIRSGDVVVVPAGAKISLRASQLGDMRLCYFGVRVEQMAGFFTAEEQEILLNHLPGVPPPVRVIDRESEVSRQYADLCHRTACDPNVLVRAAMLGVAVSSLRDLLVRSSRQQPRPGSPEKSFLELIDRIPESELLASPARVLARHCNCTDRHFRRLFQARFGVSLKQKQIEWRIERAKKLLIETDVKIIEVASKIGFRSLGQFNLYFKRLTQMTPTVWRQTQTATRVKFQRRHPPLCPQLPQHRSK